MSHNKLQPNIPLLWAIRLWQHYSALGFQLSALLRAASIWRRLGFENNYWALLCADYKSALSVVRDALR